MQLANWLWSMVMVPSQRRNMVHLRCLPAPSCGGEILERASVEALRLVRLVGLLALWCVGHNADHVRLAFATGSLF